MLFQHMWVCLLTSGSSPSHLLGGDRLLLRARCSSRKCYFKRVSLITRVQSA